MGGEFKGVVRDFFLEKEIIQKSKIEREDINQVGVADRVMQNIKKRLAQSPGVGAESANTGGVWGGGVLTSTLGAPWP